MSVIATGFSQTTFSATPSASLTVAHVLPWSTIGGTEHGALRVATAVARVGVRSLAFTAGGGEVAQMFRRAGFESFEYSPVEPSYRHPFPYLRASMQLAREFQRQGVGLVHCADLLAAYHAVLAAKLARLPVISHIRGAFPSISRRDRSFLRAVDHFLFVSRHTREIFGYPVAEDRGMVIYDGIECGGSPVSLGERQCVREELGIPTAARVVGMIARVAPVKDFATLSRAARQVAGTDPGVRFLIVGDHSATEEHRRHFQQVRKWLAEQKVEDRFIFTGQRKDIHRILSAMDVFTLCTHSEGLPLVVLEAMAYGLPVVATAVGGIPEVVKHGYTGFLHSRGDADDLAARLCPLLRDESLARRVGMAGQAAICSRFSKARFCQEIVSLYRRAVQ